MVVRWSTVAEERLKNIFNYYFDVASQKVATRIVSEIIEACDSLELMPFKAPVEKDLAGCDLVYRSLVVKKIFKIIYHINLKTDSVLIATIWDCRRSPLLLKDEISKTLL